MVLKVAQVGVGGFGRGWLKALVESDLAELVAIVDVSGEALAAARENHGIGESSCFSDLAGALERRSPEAVVCVTPPQFHGSVALEAAGAGLHILTEKPLSGELAAAREMIEAAGEAGVTLMVSQNYRHQPWARSVRRAISDGAVGEIGTVEVRFFKAPHFGFGMAGVPEGNRFGDLGRVHL